jgi:hypothetical protein
MKSKKRYKVCRFPSPRGTPWHFSNKLVAYAAAISRVLFSVEVRVIDTITGEHVLVI